MDCLQVMNDCQIGYSCLCFILNLYFLAKNRCFLDVNSRKIIVFLLRARPPSRLCGQLTCLPQQSLPSLSSICFVLLSLCIYWVCCVQDLSSTPEMEPNSLAVEAQNLTTGWRGKSPCIAFIIKPKHLVVAYNVLSDLYPSPASSFAPSVQVFSNSSILHSISTTQMHFPFLASASSGRGFFSQLFP